MKKHILMLIFALSIIFCGVQLARADSLPKTSLPMSTIIKNIQAKGYVGIEKIKFEDNNYEAKVLDNSGQTAELQINPQTGVVSQTKAPTNKISILEAAQKVEAAGYHSIFKIALDDKKYKVNALDQQGQKIELKVDGQTGTISKD